MVLLKTNTFEGGVAGTAVTAGTSARRNVAKGGIVVSSTGQKSGPGDHRLSRVIDGSLAAYVSQYRATGTALFIGAGWMQVDLGRTYNLDTIKVWHFYADGRTYHKTRTEVSTDGVTWTAVFDSVTSGEYAETSAGRTTSFALRPVRYIRDWVSGNSVNTFNHWLEVEAYGDTTSGVGFDGGGTGVLFDSGTVMHGALSMKASLAASQTSAVLWDTGAAPVVYVRTYFRTPTAPIGYSGARFVQGRTASGGGGSSSFEIGIDTGSKFVIRDGTGGGAVTGTVSYVADTWYRVEARVTFGTSTGAAEVRIYLGDSATLLDTITTSAKNYPQVGSVRFGNTVGTNQTSTFYLDDAAIGDSGWFGPSDTNSTRLNTFESGSPGATPVADVTSGEESGDEFDQVLGTAAYDTLAAHGGYGLKATLAASSASGVQWTWTFGSTWHARAYVRVGATLGYDSTVIAGRTAGGTVRAGAMLTSTGKFRASNPFDGGTWTSTQSYAANKWYRLELRVVGSSTAGQVELRIYDGDAKTLIETVASPANRNVATDVARIGFGQFTTSNQSGSVWIDDVTMSPVDWPGPLPAPSGGGAASSVIVRAHAPDGTVRGVLPMAESVKTLEEFNGPGSLSFDYPKQGPNAALLGYDAGYFSLVEGGVVRPDYYLLDQDGENPPEGGPATLLATTHPGYLAYLERGIVYPGTHTPGSGVTGLDPHHPFTTATPGTIVKTLIDKAKARGALPYVTYDFTTGADSAGVTWPTTYTIVYDAGKSIASVVQDMADNGWADARMEGTVLRVFTKDTYLGQDRANAVLRLGRDVLSGPRQRNRAVVRSHLLSLGEEGAAAEAANATTATRYGERREGFETRGGVTDSGTLTALAAASLAGVQDAPQSITVVYDPVAEPTTPRPTVDYLPGDFVRYDVYRTDTVTLEPLRVRSLASQWVGIHKTVSLELSDSFTELATKLSRKIDGIMNGSASNDRAPVPPAAPDIVPPSAPASVTVTSATYQTPDGRWHAAATVSWPQVTVNADSTAYDDVGDYRVSWSISGGTWSGEVAVNLPPLYVSGLPPGATFAARVRAVDQSGATSPLTLSSTVTLAADTTAPPTPSTLTVAATVGGFKITWNGLGSVGQAMPADFDRLEIHRSTSAGFTPSSSTLVDTLRAAGVSPQVGLVYGTTYYFKSRAVDQSGNTSAASTEVSGTPVQVVSTDIATGQVSLSNLAFAQGGNLIDDGSFEDGSWRAVRTPGLPSGWLFAQDFTNHGAWSLKILTTNSTYTLQAGLPVVPGETIYGAVDVRGTSTGAGTVLLQAVFKTAAGSTVSTVTLASSAGNLDTAWHPRVTGGPQTVPATAVTMNLAVTSSGITSGTTWLDAVEVRRQVDSLLVGAAAITTAAIANLAVNDAKIGSCSVGKLTAGTIVADVLVGSRIYTASSGTRVELNSSGVYGYLGSNPVFELTSAGSLWMSGTLEAGYVKGGSADFPDPATTAAGYTHMDADGLLVQNLGTTNLITNPSVESLTGVTTSTNTFAVNRGAPVTDYQGNTDLVAGFGKTSLKVYNAVNNNGYVEISLGTGTALGLAASGTYTYSFHASCSRISDVHPGATTVVSTLFSNVQLIEKRTDLTTRVCGSGVDLKMIVDGPGVGKITTGLPTTGVAAMAGVHWVTRWSKTFAMPSDIAGTSTFILRLPAPCDATGTVADTVKAVVYDGLQLENKAWPTRYCDGDQPGCAWAGTRNASQSSRPTMPEVWFPSYADPAINGRLKVSDVSISNGFKLGSAYARGSNFISIVRTFNDQVLNSTWEDLWYDTVGTTDRICQDDGPIFPNTFQFTSQAPGMYAYSATLTWESGTTGKRHMRWLSQGSTILGNMSWDVADSRTQTCSALSVLPGGGYYIRVQGNQASGSTIRVTVNSGTDPNAANFCQIG